MKIIDSDDIKVTLELESPDGFAAFRGGMEDHRQWSRHPETLEMATYINDNHKQAQIVVKYGDSFVRVR